LLKFDKLKTQENTQFSPIWEKNPLPFSNFSPKKKDLAYHGKFAIGKFIVVDVKEANFSLNIESSKLGLNSYFEISKLSKLKQKSEIRKIRKLI